MNKVSYTIQSITKIGWEKINPNCWDVKNFDNIF